MSQKLHDPVKNFVPKLYPHGDITQFFAENPQLYSKVCQPGGCMTGGHPGIDIVRPWGEPIYCVQGGVVVEVLEKDNGYGKHIKILSPEGFEWVYGHLSRIDVKLGDTVEGGAQIALMGNSGFVISGNTPYWKSNPYAGTHLHLGRRVFTPYSGSGSWNVTYSSGHKGTIQNYSNGFLGSVYLGPEDFGFVDGPITQPESVSSKDLAVQSLLNSAAQLEAQGKASQAAIVRAVAGVVQAFWA